MQIIRMAGSDPIKGTDNIQSQFQREGGQAKISENSYGIAVDIGTTTVDMALYDLMEGRRVSGYQEKNSQTILGADVMMRLMHCQRGFQEKLEQLIREQLQKMAEELSGFIESLGEEIWKD